MYSAITFDSHSSKFDEKKSFEERKIRMNNKSSTLIPYHQDHEAKL